MRDLATAMRELREYIERKLPMDRAHIPGAVPADVAERLSDRPSNDADRFDEYEESNIGAVVPYELQKPVACLLQIRLELKQWERIGDLNYKRVVEMLRAELDQLYLGCVERWNDL